MNTTKPDWKPNESLAAGKGATIQEFFATVGDDRLEIDVAPWGEGHLKVNGLQIAYVGDAKNRRQAFRSLKYIAERYLQSEARSGRQGAPSHDSGEKRRLPSRKDSLGELANKRP